MPVNMTWNLFSEKKPLHGQYVIWLQITSGFGAWGFKPREIVVEYKWSEVDEDGDDIGSSVCYEEGDEPLKDHRLVILADGWEISETDLWMGIEEYETFLEDNIPQLKG